jgi:hypothetical protein
LFKACSLKIYIGVERMGERRGEERGKKRRGEEGRGEGWSG